MNYWLISDTHFNHEGIEKWGDRSGNWQEKIWKGLKAIPAEDTLIHLGDICIGEDSAIHEELSKLTCKKVLVLGNHDKKSKQWYTEHGWDFVCDGLEFIYMGHYIHFTHRPTRPQGNNTFNVHGHTHGNMHRSEEYCDFYSHEYHKDISPEVVGYNPLRLDTFIKTNFK
jgi:calcineurin-like phosphoesterase family protein